MEDQPNALERIALLKLNLAELYVRKETAENTLNEIKEKLKAVRNVLAGVELASQVDAVEQD